MVLATSQQAKTTPMSMTAESLAQFGQSLANESEDEIAFRQAPHNIEAEQALLGAIMRNNESLDRVSAFLQPHHFFDPLHERIFEAAGKLIQAGKQATPITLKTFFENEEPIGELTVPQYLVRLTAATPTVVNARDYGQMVYDLAVRRSLIVLSEDMAVTAYDSPIDHPPEKQIEEAEGRLFAMAETGKYGSGFDSFGNAVTEAVEMAAAAFQRDGSLSGVSTGMTDLDQMMGGLQSSDLIVLAGRPSMGKTSLVTNIASNIASAYRTETQSDGTEKVVSGGVVGFFSLEMSQEQLATRILSEGSRISSSKIRRGEISEQEFVQLSTHARAMSTYPLFIDDTGGLTIAQVAARSRRLKRQKGLDLLIVDYIQLLAGSSKNAGNRVQEVTEITTGLKALAKELGCPVIALSQLSRQVENREDKRPQLSDLRESGSIEQDADVVLFVFREEYYLERATPPDSGPGSEKQAEWQQRMDDVRGTAEVIIGKQRHGPTGTAVLGFTGEFTSFHDLAPSDRIPERYE